MLKSKGESGVALFYNLRRQEEAQESLCVHQCGGEACPGGHRFGPAVRDHYLIHCIFRGKGRFEPVGRSYDLEAGQGFLIVPGQITVYTADVRQPWHYHWIGFSGSEAASILDICGLSAEQPIFSFGDQERMKRCLDDLEHRYEARDNAFSLLSGLYGFFALLMEDSPAEIGSGSRILDAAVDYMRKNYSYPLTVEAVARRCGADRSHLFRLFKQHLGLSPQQYLIQLRLHRAEELLRTSTLPVSDVAFSCGFNDPCHFSRLFRRCHGMPPGAFRICDDTGIPADGGQKA